MNLLDTLFGVQRQRVLGWLLLHPDESVHVRELSRLTGTSAGSLHRELARLAEAAGAQDFESLKTELAELRVRARKAFERAVPLTREEISRDGESEEPRSIS